MNSSIVEDHVREMFLHLVLWLIDLLDLSLLVWHSMQIDEMHLKLVFVHRLQPDESFQWIQFPICEFVSLTDDSMIHLYI